MFSDYIRDHKRIAALAAVLLVGLIGLSIYVAITRIGKEPVQVYLVPSDAILLVSGQQHRAGTAYISPGTHTVEVQKEGFKDYKGSITVGTPNTAAIDVALEAVSESAKKWQRDNQDLYLAYEGRAGGRANKEGEEFSRLNPITSKLPYDSLIYSVGYRNDPDDPSGNSIIIEIDAPAGYRNAALKKIRELGYDPTDFKIIFTHHESPFDNE